MLVVFRCLIVLSALALLGCSRLDEGKLAQAYIPEIFGPLEIIQEEAELGCFAVVLRAPEMTEAVFGEGGASLQPRDGSRALLSGWRDGPLSNEILYGMERESFTFGLGSGCGKGLSTEDSLFITNTSKGSQYKYATARGGKVLIIAMPSKYNVIVLSKEN